ncbi:hypothetical protein LUZ63_021589 [Rhynchospora breviuscula]|uniref:alpha-galactosidase n=1 Tax=Rhynchospora breviuscula TaxID=2022672 RepID=A0A9Q0BYJ1_9POAL|nr:hypothetical protein LUZ63_021589 [Rhynchospora breviuscula]
MGARERTPQRSSIGVGLHRREGRRGKSGADSSYLLHAGSPRFGFEGGELWALHTAWSGNHVHQFERLSSGEQVLAGGELLLPGEVRLAEGEAYRGPWIYGAYGVGLDDVARRFHRMLRGRAQHPSSPRPVTLNVWEAVYFDHDLGVLTELADLAAEIGVERFVLDDGWFGQSAQRPLGARRLGRLFGLWFEPEMANPDSDIARAHPEWILQAGGRAGVESRHQLVLDLSDPDCYAHIRDAMCAILDAYDIGYVKWDHNRDLVAAGAGLDRRPGVHAQTLAFYRLLDELKERYPQLEIESCASGGGRVDLGVLERTDRIWVSDNIDPLDRQQMNRWTTQLVPPELMGCHVASGASHTTGRVHDLGFRASAAVFGHLGIEWDLRAATDDERALLAEWVSFYKGNRGMLHSGDLVRVDHPDPAVHVHGVVAADGSEALHSYTALARSELVTPGRLRLPGLDAQRRYRVTPVLIGGVPPGTLAPDWWTDGVVLPGSVLGGAGLAAPLLRPEQSILYRAEALAG